MKVYMAVMVDEHDWQYMGARVFRTLEEAQRWLYEMMCENLNGSDEASPLFEHVKWEMKYPEEDVDHREPVRYSLFDRSYNLIVYEEEL